MILPILALTSTGAAVRSVEGPVSAIRTGEPSPVAAGDLLAAPDGIDTGADGYAELHFLGRARLRLSSSTHVALEGDHVHLIRGRAWAQAGAGGFEVRTNRHRVAIAPRSSIIVEHGSTGTLVVARAGEATFADLEGRSVRIPVGHAVHVGRGDLEAPRPRMGGRGLSELVAAESRRMLGDPNGVEAFIVWRALRVEPEARLARGISAQLRSASDVVGSDAGAAGGLVEAGIRPPPFFADEVPPKGPNVVVRIDYRE